MRPCWADWGGEEGQAQAGSSREAPSLAKWRWHFQRAAATGGTKEMSLVAFLTRWRAGRRSLRDDEEGPAREKPSTPSPVASWAQLRLLPADGFPARTSTCARVGTGVVAGSACRRRAPGSLSLSQAPADPRAPASTDRAGASRRGAAAERHAPAERARPAPARLVIVDRRSHRLGGAGSRRSCGLLHGLSAS